MDAPAEDLDWTAPGEFPEASAPGPASRYGGPLALLAVGLVFLFGAAFLDEYELSRSAWKKPVPFRALRLPTQAVPAYARQTLDALEQLDLGDLGVDLGMDFNEALIAVSLSEQEWEALLESGRAPEPGAHEVVAGELTRFTEFQFGGTTFKTVGRLRRNVLGFTFAFAIPDDASLDPLFEESCSGQFSDLGVKATDEEPPSELLLDVASTSVLMRASPYVAAATLIGLILVAVGGALLQMRFLMHVAQCPGLFRTVLEPLATHRRLLWTVHGLHYGVLFGTMALAFATPRASMWLALLVGEIFSEGGLSHIGDAYASGSILSATWETFYHNYVVATLGFCFAISMVVPFLGVLKNLLSFAVAGYSMAPLWAGSASQFTFHSITLTLELEAYVLASFVVILFPVYLVKAALDPDCTWRVRDAFAMVVSGALLVGTMLAYAALYEATTLILLLDM